MIREEKKAKRMAASKSAIMTKENLEKFNQDGEGEEKPEM